MEGAITVVEQSVPTPSKFPLSFWETTVASTVVLIFAVVVLIFAVGLTAVYLTMPDSDYSFLKLPRTLQDLKLLRLIEGMRIVGLTGGIASGKSTVSNLFKSHGVPVVDADIVAREVLRKGSGGWKKVVAAFGDEILLENGEVNRPRLGQIVFSDPDKRQFLNQLLAPYIARGIFWEVLKLWVKGYKIIVLDVPLLFEAKMDKFTKPVIVVWVDPETQIQRLLARDKSTEEEDARNRINAQMPLDVKRDKADIIIDNTGSLDDLSQHFQEVYVEVSKPLTWAEFWRSRQGVFTILASVTSGVVLFIKYSGPSKDALAYVNWLRQDNRFSDILVQISPSENGHTFPALKLRYKPSLVQFEGGMSHLQLLDPSMRAIPLSPAEWKERLEAVNKTDLRAKDYHDRDFILLDVRNGYEWDIGHFRGTQRPSVDCFRNTSFGLSQEEITASDPLSNVDKEKANILMYCTGGIRCDVYSTILRRQGFQNLYTLKGGVSHYLKNEGAAEWVGNLFVFDSRLSLPPSVYYTGSTTEAELTPVSGDDKFAKCHVCNLEVSELRHRNCANLDCNLLFLCCTKCVKDLRGCCYLTCTTAPRLRPVLNGMQRYKKWHNYRDMDLPEK